MFYSYYLKKNKIAILLPLSFIYLIVQKFLTMILEEIQKMVNQNNTSNSGKFVGYKVIHY
jgi:hypothetical protein